ncbi:MAG: hypothetical protein ACHQET_03370 [Chitinophagales bacterium]
MKHKFSLIISMICLLAIMLTASCYKDNVSTVGGPGGGSCSDCGIPEQGKNVDVTVDNWINQGYGEFESDLYLAVKKIQPSFFGIIGVRANTGQHIVELQDGKPVPFDSGTLKWMGRNLILNVDADQVPNGSVNISVTVY